MKISSNLSNYSEKLQLISYHIFNDNKNLRKLSSYLDEESKTKKMKGLERDH